MPGYIQMSCHSNTRSFQDAESQPKMNDLQQRVWYLVPENVAPVVLTVPAIGQPAWTDSTKRAGGVVYGRDGAEQVEHAANHSPGEPLRAHHLHRALQPQLRPGLIVRGSQGTRRHLTQALVKHPLGRLRTVGRGQEEAPAALTLLRRKRQRRRNGHPDEVHRRTRTSRKLGALGVPMDVPEGVR